MADERVNGQYFAHSRDLIVHYWLGLAYHPASTFLTDAARTMIGTTI